MHSIDIERFHNDAKAAVIAEIPLVGEKDRLTVGQLEQLQPQIQAFTIDDSPSNEKLQTDIFQNEALPKWYRAALTTFMKTGSMLPVLEGLSVRPLSAREATRAMRWSFIYLLIVVATALLGLWIFYAGGASAIEIFRTDLRLLAAVESQHPVNVRAWLPGIMIVMAIGLVLGVGWMLAGGVSSLTMRLGGRRYVRCNMSATILRVAQALVKTGMGVDDSVCVGCDLIGADSKVQNEVQSIVRGVDDANTIGRMADYSSLTAQKRLAQLRFGTPVYLVAILGGGLALVFCLIVFLPILALLNDLPRAGL